MIPPKFDEQSLRDFARNVDQRLITLETTNIDMGQRRVVNAAKSVSNFDYVTKFELEELKGELTQAQTKVLRGVLSQGGQIQYGTYASRPAATSNRGLVYLASDRSYIGFFSIGTGWVYMCGLHRDTFANRPTPTAAETNYPFYATDTFRLYFWNGAAWVEDILSIFESFGGTSSSFPALKRSSTTIQARLADDTDYTAIEVLDEAYDKTNWDAKVEVPTKNAIRDELELRMPGVTAHTIPLAKITAGGTNGSITVNAYGIVTAYTDPT